MKNVFYCVVSAMAVIMFLLWLNGENILNPKTFKTKTEARTDLFSYYNNSHLIKTVFEDKE